MEKQTLLFGGFILEDSYQLKAFGIENGSSIFLSFPLDFTRDNAMAIMLPSAVEVRPLVNIMATVDDLKEKL
ncbi:unnamed protein product [Dibothriocephalus latus]|uniref:Ubiquitin-like domain-containing protein n=1 Tax=Dibothriocephalus latus TaxID=60516 RepID=A0A3P7MGL7_DIBLA|nr:unnamed protein product [Dibothriocephalus latus]